MRLQLALIFSFFTSFVHSQTITGKVIDRDGRAIDLVNILLQLHSTTVNINVSDSGGTFRFNHLDSPAYRIRLSKIGYYPVDTTVDLANNQNLIIVLQKNAAELKSITVTGKKPLIERKIDRIVFNVDNNINTAGLDALEVLGKTPLLKVQNDAVSIIGKEGVSIMIDGRLQYVSGQALNIILKSIPAESIESIEVITNPPAKYDAAGNSGLVNIITKKIKRIGYYGSLTTTLNYATDFVGREVLNFNYNVKKFQFFTNISLGYGANPMTSSEEIYYPGKTWQESNLYTEYSKVGVITAGFEVPVNPRTSFGASYNRMNSYPDMHTTDRINILGDQDRLDSFLLSDTYAAKTYVDQSANLHYSHRFDSIGSKIDIDADYYANTFNVATTINTGNYYADGSLLPDSIAHLLSINNRSSSIYTLNSAVDMPIGKSHLGYGAKLSFIANDNGVSLANGEQGKFIPDTGNTNQFNVHENIQAAFVDFNRPVGKHFQLKAGLRGEFTQLDVVKPTGVEIKNDRYFSLFPTLFFKYDPSDNNSFTINYGRRFNRPAFSSLNPFRLYQNTFSYSMGNPALAPYYTNNIEFNYAHGGNLYASILADHTTGQIGVITYVNDSNTVRYTQPGNFLKQDDITFTVGGTIKFFRILESQNEVSAYYSHAYSNSPATIQSLGGWGGTFRSSNTFTLNRQQTIFAGIDYNWQSSDVSGIYRERGYNFLDLSFRQMLAKKKFQLTLAVRDIFKTKNIHWSQTTDGITINSFTNNNSRRLVLTARYNFGNSRIRKGGAHASNAQEQSLIR